LTNRFTRLGQRLARSELASNAFWSAVGEAIFRGTALVTTAIVARLLGAADFGVFGLIRNGATQFGGLGTSGLGLTANRFLPAYSKTDPERAGALIGASLGISAFVGLVLAAVGLAASEWIAVSLLEKPELVPAVRLGVGLVAVAGINGAQLGVLQGLEAFRPLALGYLLSGVFGGGALLLGAHFFGLPGALAGLAVVAVLNLAMFQVVIAREARRQSLRVIWSRWRLLTPILLGFALPTALIAVAIGPLRWLAESWLVRTSGLSEAGLFYAGMIVFSLVVGLVTTLHSPLLSMVARRSAAGTLGRLRWISLYASWYAFLAVSLPLLLFPGLPGWALGGDYRLPGFVQVLLLILLYSGLQSYAQGLTRAIAQSGSMWFLLVLSIVESAVLIGAFLVLAGRGAVGLAMAAVISYLARLVVTVPVVVRKGVVEFDLLVDRRFIVSLSAFLALLGYQWLRVA